VDGATERDRLADPDSETRAIAARLQVRLALVAIEKLKKLDGALANELERGADLPKGRCRARDGPAAR
jgi:hypothetical protein